MTYADFVPLLTRQMFCGAAVATLVGLGVGAWATPPLEFHDPDPYANAMINPPTERVVDQGAYASEASWPSAQPAASSLRPAAWTTEPYPADPLPRQNAAVVQQIAWEPPVHVSDPPPQETHTPSWPSTHGDILDLGAAPKVERAETAPLADGFSRDAAPLPHGGEDDTGG